MEDTDAELVKCYRSGDVGALQRLVEKYERPLLGFITHMVEGHDEAQEIFQEVWFRAINRLDRYRHRNFGGWLIRIARNLVIDRARRHRPDWSLDAEYADGWTLHGMLASASPDPFRAAADAETGRRIREAVAALPAEQREVFLLRVQANFSFKEIARIQRVSINTALARMQYALKKLRTALQDEYAAMMARPEEKVKP